MLLVCFVFPELLLLWFSLFCSQGSWIGSHSTLTPTVSLGQLISHGSNSYHLNGARLVMEGNWNLSFSLFWWCISIWVVCRICLACWLQLIDPFFLPLFLCFSVELSFSCLNEVSCWSLCVWDFFGGSKCIVQIFEPGIKDYQSDDIVKEGGTPGSIQRRHNYLLEPVAGTAQYFKLGNEDSRSPDRPAQKAVVILDDVTISLSEVMLYIWVVSSRTST